MLKVIALNSFRGGTGKSNITANLAAMLAQLGHRVGVIDTDLPSPGIHIVLGLDQSTIAHTLNDYLWGTCTIAEATHDVTPEELSGEGRLFLAPASFNTEDINRIVREGYDVDRLSGGINDMAAELALDFLLVDTHPGLNSETLMAMALSDRLIVILRPDSQDFQGTAVTVDVSQQLGVPRTYVLVNRVLEALKPDQVKALVSKTYGLPVLGILPNTDEMMLLGSRSLFCLRFPSHPFSNQLRAIAKHLSTESMA
jgi:MinD-like ATPase involved in chromosome partitioning or flagellar assembly